MRYRVPRHVTFQSVDDEVVVLDERANAYLALNSTAAAAWLALAAGGSLEAAVAALVARFDVDETIADADVRALTERLTGQGLLEPEHA